MISNEEPGVTIIEMNLLNGILVTSLFLKMLNNLSKNTAHTKDKSKGWSHNPPGGIPTKQWHGYIQKAMTWRNGRGMPGFGPTIHRGPPWCRHSGAGKKTHSPLSVLYSSSLFWSFDAHILILCIVQAITHKKAAGIALQLVATRWIWAIGMVVVWLYAIR